MDYCVLGRTLRAKDQKLNYGQSQWRVEEKWTLLWATEMQRTHRTQRQRCQEWQQIFFHHCPNKVGVARSKLTTQRYNTITQKYFTEEQQNIERWRRNSWLANILKNNTNTKKRWNKAAKQVQAICFLSTTYKWLTGIVADAIYQHLDNGDYLEKQQKAFIRKRLGTKDQLLTNKANLEDCMRRQRNLSMAWIDTKRHLTAYLILQYYISILYNRLATGGSG